MKHSIGFLEYRSIARGLEATDLMLKSGNVQLIQNSVLCPGKYTVMITGDVGATETAIQVGSKHDPATFLDSIVIPNIHPNVLPALTATSEGVLHDSWGIIETVDASAAIIAADAAAKAANIDLLEIRLARGMGGKGYVSLCGDLAAVTSAVEQAANLIGADGLLIATSVIAAPNPQLSL